MNTCTPWFGVAFSITLKTIHRKDTYMKQPEIGTVISCGFMEALEAAVRSGADAVYLGGSLFSARANAQNFDHDTLKQAVAYCHARGVKVHLAVNTILLNHEIEPALDFVAFGLLRFLSMPLLYRIPVCFIFCAKLRRHCKFMLPHKCPCILRKVQSCWQHKVSHWLY